MKVSVRQLRRIIKEELQVNRARCVIREALMREYLEVPNDWDEFLRQHKGPIREIMEKLDPIILAYERMAEDEKLANSVRGDAIQAAIESVYRAIESDAFKQSGESGVRKAA